MSLVFCPECGHEVSVSAAACPNCAHPMRAAPVVERKVVVPPQRREGGFPPWAFVPIGVLGVILLVVMYAMLRDTDEESNVNVNVNLAGRRTTADSERDSRTVTVPPADTQSVTVPGQTTTVPGQTTTVPGTTTELPVAPPPEKGTVVINAKVAPARGSTQAARSAKFFLLDESLESILNEARLEPVEGNSLTASLGLAVVYPDRYGDFYRAAMRAINSHVKYSGTTDGKGSASLTGIDPDQYYLFGITRVGQGFALWNAPVSIIAGQNVLNLSPQSVTEIPDNAS